MRLHGLSASPRYAVRVTRASGVLVVRLRLHSKLAADRCAEFLRARHPLLRVCVARMPGVV